MEFLAHSERAAGFLKTGISIGQAPAEC
jgi:hypothetical protein